MPRTITVEELLGERSSFSVVDVRKEPARRSSGLTVAGSVYRKPFDAENWWREFAGARVAVFCVHGHEVSRAVCSFLADNDVDAFILEGGFEAWREAGCPVEAIEEGS